MSVVAAMALTASTNDPDMAVRVRVVLSSLCFAPDYDSDTAIRVDEARICF